MPAQHRPRCGFCFKEFPKVRTVQAHISNNSACRAARDKEQARLDFSPNLKVPKPSDLANEFQGNIGMLDVDELDYVPSERLAQPPTTDFSDETAQSQRISVEVEDEPEQATFGRYGEDYDINNVATTFGKSQTAFEKHRAEQIQEGLGEKPWAPFEDEEEWELAQFLMKELTQTAIDKFSKLPIVSETNLRCWEVNQD
jgi:hypothetical protein